MKDFKKRNKEYYRWLRCVRISPYAHNPNIGNRYAYHWHLAICQVYRKYGIGFPVGGYPKEWNCFNVSDKWAAAKLSEAEKCIYHSHEEKSVWRKISDEALMKIFRKKITNRLKKLHII